MIIETKYGDLFGVTSYETYENGQVSECNLAEENTIKTSYGHFIPKYSEAFGVDERLVKHKSSISFHENGIVKRISLDKQMLVKTNMGMYPAEMITFYTSGKLHRVFPLNGVINGYWSEEDEGRLAESFTFTLGVGTFSAKIISLRFYPSGKLRALALWPGEVIQIKTPVGTMEVRHGFSLYEDGSLQSVEPHKPIFVTSEIGDFLAFDADALGIHADQNSIKFTQAGKLKGFTTSTYGVHVKDEHGNVIKVGPQIVPSYVDISENVIMPICVSFEDEHIVIDNGISQRFSKSHHSFKAFISTLKLNAGCTSCSSCNACG